MDKNGLRTEKRIADYFRGCLYFSCGRLFRLIDGLAGDAFRPLAMAPSHAFLLMALAESPARQASPSQLARIMNLDRSTVTRLVAHLEKRTWVRRTRSGRHTAVELLPGGRALLPGIRACWSDLYRAYGRVLGEAAATELNRCIVEATKEMSQP